MVKQKHYKDTDKWREVWRKQKRRYYAKSQIYTQGRRGWTYEEDQLVLSHSIPDSELAAKIQRSVGAIQKRRWLLNQSYANTDSKRA